MGLIRCRGHIGDGLAGGTHHLRNEEEGRRKKEEGTALGKRERKGDVHRSGERKRVVYWGRMGAMMTS
jgi:hypothetical protein